MIFWVFYSSHSGNISTKITGVNRKSIIRFILNILPTVSVLLFYFADNLKLVYIASVLQGISMSGATLSWQVCVMEFAPKHQVGIYMGIHTMLTGLRGIVATFAGAYLISAAGIGNTFLY